jgi:methionine-rich copper-binding protein CopC
MRLSSMLLIGLLVAALVSLSGLSADPVLAVSTLPLHASVWRSDPAIGSTIASAPTQVTVFTLESIKPQGSSLQVYGPGPDATDALISQGSTRFPLTDSRQMAITIAPLSGHLSGVYIVFWHTVSADDGDPDSGSFTFTVSAGGRATPTPARSTTPTSPSTGAVQASALWVPIGAALVALIAGLGIGFGLGRRRSGGRSLGALRASIVQTRTEEEAGERS